MVKSETEIEIPTIRLTESQLQNLGQYIETYVKVTALSATNISRRSEIEKKYLDSRQPQNLVRGRLPKFFMFHEIQFEMSWKASD